MFHETQLCGHQYVSLRDCHPCSSQQAEATANCCTLKNHGHFPWNWQNQPLTFKPGTVFQFVSLMRLLFSDVWFVEKAMLSCWPIFAPSWILLTHCHTRGFWIHCPSELPWYECKHVESIGYPSVLEFLCASKYVWIISYPYHPCMLYLPTFGWILWQM